MPRYILTHRMAGNRTVAQLRASRKAMDNALKKIRPGLVREDFAPEDLTERRAVVIDAAADEIRAIRKGLSRDLLIEPEVLHKRHAAAPAAPAPGHTMSVAVRGGGAGLKAARVTIIGNGFNALPPAFTGAGGETTLHYPGSVQPAYVLAEPLGGFWEMYTVFQSDHVQFTCPPLPTDGPLQWWHRAVGIQKYDPSRGEGIRIGVVGTGAGPHPCLSHVSRIDGKDDVDRHDTHVCGILAARPVRRGQFAGIAPGAEVFSACVYKTTPSGEVVAEHQGVFARVIEKLARSEKQRGYGVDLINLSFGEARKSAILQDAIGFALERGVLCICSAGNNRGGALDYPAAFPETVAVTALGKKGWGPEGSITSFWVPDSKDKFGAHNLYLASMSSSGKGVSCTAPGSGIISTMPAGSGQKAPYAAQDGTSLASPMACGVLAVLLSALPDYLALPRNSARAKKAKAILLKRCASIGLRREYQGAGLPMIG